VDGRPFGAARSRSGVRTPALKPAGGRPMTGSMSVEAAVARVAELQSAFAPRTVAAATAGPAVQQGSPSAFASMLGGAQAPGAVGMPQGGPAGARLLAAVQGEVGQAEQPPGSNDSPRIAQYRQATAGAPGPGPWCAYFVSWAAQQAGAPLGAAGQGFGRVDDVYAWAQSAGKAIPAGSVTPPQPGDLIVWDEHIGVVEAVLPDGRIQTIEGNSSDQVARRTYGPDGGGAIGFVRVG
jgi:hypothetical protein